MTGAELLLCPSRRDGAGTGHLARCYALAEFWTRRVGTAVLWADAVPTPWHDRFESLGVGVVAERPQPSFAWAVLDGYEFTAADHRATRAIAERILVVDDHCSLGTYDADLVVDQNLGAAGSGYDVGERLLAGPRYALLRSEFRVARPAHVRVESVVRRIAHLGGGSPSPEVESSIARASELLTAYETVQFADQRSFASTLATADLVLSAAGITALEICCLGLPAVLFSVADNQRPVAERLAAAGAAVDAGDVGDGADPVALAGIVAALAGDQTARRDLAQHAWALVDGEGAPRVVTRMRAMQIGLRAATIDDAPRLFEWRTDEETQRWSFSSAEISWEDHISWLRRTLDDVTSLLLVAEEHGTPVGQVRFDTGSNDGAEVSVTMAALARGGGLGAAVVAAGVDRLFQSTSTDTVIARIKPGNLASIATFVRADFEQVGAEQHGGSDVLLYSRPRHATRV